MAFERQKIDSLGILNAGRIGNATAMAPPTDTTFRDLAMKGAFNTLGGMASRYFEVPEATGEYAQQAEVDSWKKARAWYEDPANKGDAGVFNKGLADWKEKNPNAGGTVVKQNLGGWFASKKPDLKPGFVYEDEIYTTPNRENQTLSPLAVKQAEVAPPPVVTSPPVAKITHTPSFEGAITVDPNSSASEISRANSLNRMMLNQDARKQFMLASKKKGIDNPYAYSWNERSLKGDALETENIKDALSEWVRAGMNVGSNSKASVYFRDPKNKGQYEEYKKDPYAWYAKNIEPKKNFREFSWFGN